MKEKETKNFSDIAYGVLKSLLMSMVLTAVLLLLISVIYLLWDLDENTCRNIITAMAVFSVFISALGLGRTAQKNGLLLGSVLGALYAMVLYFTGFLAFGFPGFGKSLVATLLLCVICGGAGGIAGVNMRGKR